MADTSPSAGLLDRAGHVFSLAQELGSKFQAEHERQRESGRIDPSAWPRFKPRFEQFSTAIHELGDFARNPPQGLERVAAALRTAETVANQIRSAMLTPSGKMEAEFLDYFPHLNSAGEEGRIAIRDVRQVNREHAPIASNVEGEDVNLSRSQETSESAITPSKADQFARFLELDHLVKSPEKHHVPLEVIQEYQSLSTKFGVFRVDGIFVGPFDPTRMPRTVPIENTSCLPIRGANPLICPRSKPRLPVEALAGVEKRFRSLRLVGRDQTVLWVGQQASPETVCMFRQECSCFPDEISSEANAKANPEGGIMPGALPTCKVPGITSLNVLRAHLEMLAYPDWRKRYESWPEVPYIRLRCADLFLGQPFTSGTIELLIAWFQENGLTPEQARHLPLNEAVTRLRAALNSPNPESALPPVGAKKSEGDMPLADPYAELRRFAQASLKGKERAVVEALCDAGGELSIADLAVKEGVDWDDPLEGFKGAQRRLNDKLKSQFWQLKRQSNKAKLHAVKRGAKKPPSRS
jgi:hypothetical protein